jgi:hypothetical protein
MTYHALLAALRSGATLHRQSGGTWWLEPSGQPVETADAEVILANPRVQSLADALLPGAAPQSFAWRQLP